MRLLRKVVEPVGSSKADWEIFLGLSNAFGLRTDFKTPSEIYDEMASLTYYFRGISHKRLGTKGLQWPCTNEFHPGTERLYINNIFPPGKAFFHPIPYREPSEKLTEEYPLVLVTGRRLYHFNNAAQTRRTETASGTVECLDMNPGDIDRFRFKNGQKVRLSSRRGSIVIPIRSDLSILEGTVFASFHDPEYLINILTGGPRDKHTDTYSYKYTAVEVEPPD